MICYVPLMSAAKKKSSSSLSSESCGFLRECACVCVHALSVYEPVFVLYQSISICEQHCSVGRSVAALWLSITSAPVKQICSSVAVQTNVYHQSHRGKSSQLLQSHPNKSKLKRGQTTSEPKSRK